jgi:short-subunit dehydrogenase
VEVFLFGILAFMNIANKTILISGASDGIGRSIALCLSKQNVNLILLGRDKTKLEEVKNQCEANGSRAETYAFDLTDKPSLDCAAQSIKAAGQVDVIINNAGVWHKSTPLGQLDVETIE